MSHLVRDTRFGLRLLWKTPGFTIVAVLALALGIGANTAIFSIVYATLLAPLRHHDPDRLVMVWSKVRGNRNTVSAGDYFDWKRRSTVFQDLNAWTGRSFTLSLSDRTEQVGGGVTTPGFYTMVGVPFALGRDFRPEESEPGKDDVVLLTNRFWRERLGGDPGVIGRQIRIDRRPRTVVGVLRPGDEDRSPDGLTLPLVFTPDQINHDAHWLLVMGRLKPGVTLAQANGNMDAVTRHLAEERPSSNKGWSASVEPLKNNFLPRTVIAALWLLMGAVGFVLLIACANVANLMLARATTRAREIAVRASLGASRRQLFQQLLTESVVLAGIGAALGVALAALLLDAIMALMPPETLPLEADVRLSLPVLLFTLAACVVSGILFGCVPAWQATRVDLNTTLKDDGHGSIGGRQHRLRRTLVVAEFALALTLLAGGGLSIHSLANLTSVELGFRRDHLLTFSIPTPSEQSNRPEHIEARHREFLARLQAIPGVVSASASTGMPVFGTRFGMPVQIAGRPVGDPSQRPGAGFNMVTPEYFETFGIRIDRGRAFTDADRAGAPPVAIVNETLVRQYFPGVDPLTQRIVVEQLLPGKLGPPIEWQIVGVYRDVRNRGPRGDFPEIDVPFWQSPWPQARFAVRTAGDPSSVRNDVAAVVRSVDPDLPLAEVKTMDQIVDESLAGDRFGAALFGGFAGLALLLAAVGIYGAMSFSVAQRRHEIGLRMALGAGREDVLRQILREGLATALIGIALGSIGAYFVGRAMQGMWFEVGALDPVAFGVVAVVLLGSALLACLVPARRAASVDPLTALRGH